MYAANRENGFVTHARYTDMQAWYSLKHLIEFGGAYCGNVIGCDYSGDCWALSQWLGVASGDAHHLGAAIELCQRRLVCRLGADARHECGAQHQSG